MATGDSEVPGVKAKGIRVERASGRHAPGEGGRVQRGEQAPEAKEGFGLGVVRLHREAIGRVECDVPEGGLRLLSEEEIRVGLGFDPSRGTAGRKSGGPAPRE
jgi:hypothetical protein